MPRHSASFLLGSLKRAYPLVPFRCPSGMNGHLEGEKTPRVPGGTKTNHCYSPLNWDDPPSSQPWFTFGPLCQFFGSELLLGSTGSVKALETEGKWGCCLLCFFSQLEEDVFFLMWGNWAFETCPWRWDFQNFCATKKNQLGSTGSIGIDWPHFANMFSWFFYTHFLGWTKLFHP